ncbi:MAG: TIGR04002 family protein [Oscillospiraceae bacterium]|nr:TIGR04002 family protein [Oscillospiraceae bacterium]
MRSEIKTLTLSALFTALILLATAYLFHINMPIGYIHLGDAFIYLAASFLPAPYAIAAAAIGAAAADVLTGAAIWAFPSLLIKSLMVLPFSAKSQKILSKRNLTAAIFAGLICMTGYAAAEWILYGPAGLIAGLPPALLQSAGSAFVYCAIGLALDKVRIKEYLKGF